MIRPKISIIIPTYNSEKTISVTLESISSQLYATFEVVVIDGISTDDTVNIVKQYMAKDKRISLYCEKDNGIYDAMNKGIRKSKGEWMFFLGSDDSLYDNNVLLKIAEVADQKKELRFIYGNVLLSKPIGFHHKSLVFDGEFSGNRLIYMNICHQSIFYHRSLFTEFGMFNADYKLLADWDFNLRCFNLVKPYYVDIIVANFFAGASSNLGERDKVFDRDLIKNMALRYPYSYRHHFFRKTKKALSKLFLQQLFSLRLLKALKVSRVLLYQLKPTHSELIVNNFGKIFKQKKSA